MSIYVTTQEKEILDYIKNNPATMWAELNKRFKIPTSFLTPLTASGILTKSNTSPTRYSVTSAYDDVEVCNSLIDKKLKQSGTDKFKILQHLSTVKEDISSVMYGKLGVNPSQLTLLYQSGLVDRTGPIPYTYRLTAKGFDYLKNSNLQDDTSHEDVAYSHFQSTSPVFPTSEYIVLERLFEGECTERTLFLLLSDLKRPENVLKRLLENKNIIKATGTVYRLTPEGKENYLHMQEELDTDRFLRFVISALFEAPNGMTLEDLAEKGYRDSLLCDQESTTKSAFESRIHGKVNKSIRLGRVSRIQTSNYQPSLYKLTEKGRKVAIIEMGLKHMEPPVMTKQDSLLPPQAQPEQPPTNSAVIELSNSATEEDLTKCVNKLHELGYDRGHVRGICVQVLKVEIEKALEQKRIEERKKQFDDMLQQLKAMKSELGIAGEIAV